MSIVEFIENGIELKQTSKHVITNDVHAPKRQENNVRQNI